MNLDGWIIIGMVAVTVVFLGGQSAWYFIQDWQCTRRFRREYPDLCKGMWGEGKPINKEWRDKVLKEEAEILKEEKDHYQDGEDEIAETYDSADEAVDDLQRKCFP